MRDLDPAARRVLALAAAARTPSEEDKARVARRLAVAVGASAALGTANSAAHAASGLATSKWAVGLTATKAFIAVGALLATALTGYALMSRSEPTRPAAPLRAAAPARIGPRKVEPSPTLRDISRNAGANPPEQGDRAPRALPGVAPSSVVAADAMSAPHEVDGVVHTTAPHTAAGPAHEPPTSRAAVNGARTTPGVGRVAAPSAKLNASAVAQISTPRTAAGHADTPQAAANSARTTAAHDAAGPPRATSADTAAPSDALAAELDLLHRAQVAWRSRDAASALALLNEHRARYPRSTLQLERDGLEVLTLCELGQQAEAKRLAHSVLSRAPHSPLRASLEESCALK